MCTTILNLVLLSTFVLLIKKRGFLEVATTVAHVSSQIYTVTSVLFVGLKLSVVSVRVGNNHATTAEFVTSYGNKAYFLRNSSQVMWVDRLFWDTCTWLQGFHITQGWVTCIQALFRPRRKENLKKLRTNLFAEFERCLLPKLWSSATHITCLLLYRYIRTAEKIEFSKNLLW